jgi:hypothetical protein
MELNPMNNIAAQDFGLDNSEEISIVEDVIQSPKSPVVINFLKPENLQWTKFRKSALLETVQQEPIGDQELLVDDFREKWNAGNLTLFKNLKTYC